MKKLKAEILKARETGRKLTPHEIIVYKMACSEPSNLLDVLVIDEPFYWDVSEWLKILDRCEVNEVLVDLNATNIPELDRYNGDQIVAAFVEAGFQKAGTITSKVRGVDVRPVKGVILKRG